MELPTPRSRRLFTPARLPALLRLEATEGLELEQQRVRLSYHVIIASLMWKAAAGAALKSRSEHGNERIYILRYEDLIAQPVDVFRELTDWLSIRFDPEMLSTVPIGTSSYSSLQSDAGVTAAAANRWRQRVSAAEIRAIQLCTRKVMVDFGYELLEERTSLFTLIRPWISLPWAVLGAAWANRSRSGGIVGYVAQRIRALF